MQIGEEVSVVGRQFIKGKKRCQETEHNDWAKGGKGGCQKLDKEGEYSLGRIARLRKTQARKGELRRIR